MPLTFPLRPQAVMICSSSPSLADGGWGEVSTYHSMPSTSLLPLHVWLQCWILRIAQWEHELRGLFSPTLLPQNASLKIRRKLYRKWSLDLPLLLCKEGVGLVPLIYLACNSTLPLCYNYRSIMHVAFFFFKQSPWKAIRIHHIQRLIVLFVLWLIKTGSKEVTTVPLFPDEYSAALFFKK